jgi:hypothetical protein
MTTEQLTIAQVLLRQFDPQRALHQCGTAGVLLLHSLRTIQQFGRRSPLAARRPSNRRPCLATLRNASGFSIK